MTIVNPGRLPKATGFSHGVLAPPGSRALFVAGQTAADESGIIARREFVAQFDVALSRVLEVVRTAGGVAEHVTRMTVYVTDLDAYRLARVPLGEVWRQRMGRHYPAMTLVEVSRLLDADATVEIDAIAYVPVETAL